MNRKFLFVTIFLFFFLTAAKAQSLSGSIGRGFIKRGEAAKATVVLDIPDGIHTNSNRPTGEFAIPTTMKVSGANVKIGTVMYPAGKDKKFEFAEEPLNVYEGRTVFNFIVSVPKNYRKKSVTIRAVVDYQACTHEVCYPPKKQEIILTAKVR